MSQIDSFRIDGHKLMYHIPRVHQWLRGEDIYPIYVEIGITNRCNHRCIFCALDYLGYKASFIDGDLLKRRLSEMARLGIKSLMYAGEGEPLLHKDIALLIGHTKKVGIDVALTTNGVFLNANLIREILNLTSWIRVSLDAGKPQTYSKIHRCRPEDFERVLKNITTAVKLKERNRYKCTIGVQFLLLPENYKETKLLANRVKEIGVDYLIIKPYSQHPLSLNRLGQGVDYSTYMYLKNELREIEDGRFKVFFRENTMEKLKRKKSYRRCLGLPFWTYISSSGDIYACSAFLGKAKYCYGNIYKATFKEIWEGEMGRAILRSFATEFDVEKCRPNCRLDEINRYLWELKHPHPHVNFI